MKRILRSKWLWIALVIGLVAFLFTNYTISNQRDYVASLRNTNRSKVERKQLTQLVLATGKVRSQDVRNLYSESAGRVVEVKFKVGDKIKSGQELLRLETTNRAGRKVTEGLDSPGDYTVTASSLAVDQQILAGQTILAELSALDKLEIEVELAELDATKTKPGQTVAIIFPALQERKLAGVVSEVSEFPVVEKLTTGSSEAGVKYSVVVKLNSGQNTEGMLIGLSADLEIEIARKDDALALSDVYIYKRNGKSFVKTYVDSEGSVTISEVEVILGFRGETEVEILSGLRAGEEVVLPTVEIRNQRGALRLFS